MRGFDPFKAFGTEVAETYDDFPRGDEAETVDFIHALAGSGPVLELASGTGRIGLPLAARGVRVDGVEISEAMVARLRSKPGGDGLAITIGDFAAVPVEGRYRLIYVVFNTLFNLLTQDDQVRCFQNVAAHLTDDGSFVVEAGPPNWLYHLRNDQHVDAEAIEVSEVRLDVLRHDPLTQTIEESHVFLSPHGVRMWPVVQRYSWNTELDLMARIAGLRLKERWAGWNREPFGAASPNCISVYGR